jgi:hypothetical protein
LAGLLRTEGETLLREAMSRYRELPMYDEARHERLIEAKWDEEQAHDTIDRIVQDTHAHFDPQKLWQIHPLDQFRPDFTEPFKMLYFGAAGVIWAMHYLNEVGATQLKHDYSNVLTDLALRNRADLKLSEPDTFSYLMGDVGILLVQWRLVPTDALATKSFEQLRQTYDIQRGSSCGVPPERCWRLFSCTNRQESSAGKKRIYKMYDTF